MTRETSVVNSEQKKAETVESEERRAYSICNIILILGMVIYDMKMFDITRTVEYWIVGAKYDLGVATAMLKAKKYPYALFMGHLALEKLLKALVVKRTKKHAPFTHSLPYLAERSSVKLPGHIEVRLQEFMEFHFEGRYPDANRAFYRKCTKDFTTRNLREIKEVFKWVKEKL